jgi:rfaE bifunctional protein nucleotidyltransferase chain/domain
LTPAREKLIDTQRKILTADTLQAGLAELPRPLVFTNGCFDILHRGHTTYLEQARNLGAALIVAVNSDESVRRQNKGPDRPLNPLQDRLSVLASLQCVDAVVSFDEDTPAALIEQVRPDKLVKGGDWAVDQIVGADFVQSIGGSVHSIEFQFNRSTTALVERIRESNG